ncbi:MAG TPA: DUF92 domain-containing protein [Thermoplasmata archaeon]|nr:DUF92 domain-containing protein [Thermoplasmata archaeon]
MVLGTFEAALGIVVTAGLALGAVAARALTPIAGVVAAAFGAAIVVLVGYPFLAMLILFVVASVLATRYHIQEKQRKNVQEGTAGERGISNVVAHIVLPTGLAIAGGWVPPVLSTPSLAVLYASALAFGAADTFASELGVLAGSARSILTWRPVPPGTNGGVSAIGEAWALVGGGLTAIVGLALFRLFGTPVPNAAVFLGTVAGAGFLGCQVDSLLGETLENRGYLTKGSTNFLGMLSSIAIAAGVLLAAGVAL